jgi:glycosyltransferase involved in cell wall biosynthesis
VAYSAAAVPETLGDAGLLLNDKTPAVVASAVARVVADPALRAALIAAGRRRLARFSLPGVSAELTELAAAVADGAYDRPTVAFGA